MADKGEFASKEDMATKPVEGRKSQEENANDFRRFCGVNPSEDKIQLFSEKYQICFHVKFI